MTFEEAPTEPTKAHSMWHKVGTAIHATIQPKITAARTEATTSMLERIESDLVPLVQPVAQRLLDDPTTPEEIRPVLQVLAGPEHFSGSIVIAFAVGGILSPVLQAALGPALQALTNTAWHGAATTPGNPGTIRPTPSLLAESVLKAVLTESAAASIAADSGISAEDFATLVASAGQSIGLESALLLERRQQWSGVTIQDALAYSNMNPKFYASALNLKYSPVPAGEVIAANLKGHLDDATAATLLGHTGIDPTNQPLLKLAAGRPIGIEKAAELAQHGLITAARLEQIVQQSDVNDTFLPEVKLAAYWLPPPRSIMAMFRAKAITEAQARDAFAKAGVQEPWVTAMITEGTHTGTTSVKTLTASQVTEMYQARLMPAATALARVVAIGYSAADAQALLDLADERRTVALQNAALRKIGAEYVGRKITLAQATSAMSAAAIPTAAQHDAVTYWDVEKSVNIHTPTPAQVVGAFRRGEISAANCKLRLQQLGVADADIGIFVADGYPPTKAAQAQTEAAAVMGA